MLIGIIATVWATLILVALSLARAAGKANCRTETAARTVPASTG